MSTCLLKSRLGEHMRQHYAAEAKKYRQDDEHHVTGHDHKRLCSKLRALCRRSPVPLHVLDLGCGTGRHFHCLRNVASLTALDVSPEMLEEAKMPVNGGQMDITCIHYRCEDFYSASFPANRFHLVYCLGVFGNGCALTQELTDKIFKALRPDCCFFFDVLDGGYLPLWRRLRKRLRALVYHALPETVQSAWDAQTGWPPAFMPTRRELRAVLSAARFLPVELQSEVSILPSGKGRKLECMAWKPFETPRLAPMSKEPV